MDKMWASINLEIPSASELELFVQRWVPRAGELAIQALPRVERFAWDVGELAFGFKRALRQVALMGCLQCWIVGVQMFRKWRRRWGPTTQKVEALARTTTFEEWHQAAKEMDAADGGLAWRSGAAGEKLVDARGLRQATKRLEQLQDNNNNTGGAASGSDAVHRAMYALRGGALLGREAMGLAEPKLYERARTGGPVVVEAYLEAATKCLDMVEHRFDPSVPLEARLAFFNECRHAHGRTALLLSGGAGLGAYHLGVVAALRDARLLPRVISGASAGSIVAATVCCRADDDLGDILNHMAADGDDNTEDDDDQGDEWHLPPADRVKGDPIFRLDFFRWRSSNNLLFSAKASGGKSSESSKKNKKKKGHENSFFSNGGAVRMRSSSSVSNASSGSSSGSLSSCSGSGGADNIFSKSLRGGGSKFRRVPEEGEDDDGRGCPTSPPRENLLTDPSKTHREEEAPPVAASGGGGQKKKRAFDDDDASRYRRRRSENDEALFEDDGYAPPPESALMCGDHLARVIRTNVGGDLTFQEAFDKTGKILNVPVIEHDPAGDVRRVKAGAPPRLLNYLTAPHVVVWSASRASCALPGAFAASPLLVRGRDGILRYEDDDDDAGSSSSSHGRSSQQQQRKKKVRTVYVDGSMGADLPFETMRTLFNCNHFVCSQTNVHAACFGDSALRLISAVAPGVRAPGLALTSSLHIFDVTHAVLNFVKAQLRTWIRDGSTMVDALSAATPLHHGQGERGLLAQLWEAVVPWQFGGWALAVTTQPYEGRAQDVTIVPFAGHLSAIQSLLTTTKNPEKGNYIADVMDAAKKNTWREIAKIRDHTAVEFALERAVHRLRKELFQQREKVILRAATSSQRVPGPGGAATTTATAANTTRAGGVGIGRTPSFYTSASILQLSGLAVVDPLVSVAPLSLSSSRQLGLGGGGSPGSRRSSLLSAAAAAERNNGDHDGGNGGDADLPARKNSIADFDDYDDYDDAVRRTGGHLSPVIDFVVADDARKTRRAASAGALEHEKGIEPPPDVVCKTSSMANFYYRKPPRRRNSLPDPAARAARSDDKLAYRAQHPSTSHQASVIIRRNSSTISDGGPEFF